MVRGGSVGWTAGWDLLTIFRQSSWSSSSRWRQQETRCKCLVPQRYRHVDLGHLHQISQLVCSAATAAPAAAAVPWDHHCCEDCQAQEQQEPFELIFQTPDPEMICTGRQELLRLTIRRTKCNAYTHNTWIIAASYKAKETPSITVVSSTLLVVY